jgi:hypothetical protein
MIHQLKAHKGKTVDQLIFELEQIQLKKQKVEESYNEFKASIIGKYFKIKHNNHSITYAHITKPNLWAEQINITPTSYRKEERSINGLWFNIPQINQTATGATAIECSKTEYNEAYTIIDYLKKYFNNEPNI